MSTPLSAGLEYSNNPPVARRKWKRRLLQVATPLAAVYFAVLAGFDYAMHQPPEIFFAGDDARWTDSFFALSI